MIASKKLRHKQIKRKQKSIYFDLKSLKPQKLLEMPSQRPKKCHSDYLKLVCFFCHKKSIQKGRFRYLSAPQKKYIKNKLFPDFCDKVMPSGCCAGCNAIISDLIYSEKSTRVLPAQNYEETYRKLSAIPPLTRSNPNCVCFICATAKDDCIKPKSKIKTVKYEKCDNCFAEKIPGKHKNCNRAERIKNLKKDITPRTRMQLALETIIEEQSKKRRGSPIRASRVSGGPSMAISAGANVEKNDS